MNKVLALIACLSIGAMATPVFNLEGTTGYSEKSLQSILNDLTVRPNAGVSSIDVNKDQVKYDEVWDNTGSGGSLATFVIELAGNSETNTFGIYDLASDAFLEVFSGAATAGSQATIKFLKDGTVSVIGDVGTYGSATFKSDKFGFYLGTAANGTFYSQVSKNADGLDHMVAFQGNNSDYIQIEPFAEGLWSSNEYILAWEDLSVGSDRDFNDFVVLVESVTPVPEPATMSLIGIGLAAMLSGSMIRRKRS